MRTALRRVSLSLGLAMALAIGFVQAPAALAQPSSCFRAYVACMNTAANLPSFGERTSAGMDCYVDLVGCVRRAIFG